MAAGLPFHEAVESRVPVIVDDRVRDEYQDRSDGEQNRGIQVIQHQIVSTSAARELLYHFTNAQNLHLYINTHTYIYSVYVSVLY